jgi:thiamine-phosphate pyrophosphorylase
MTARQTIRRQWLIADMQLGDRLWPIVRKLPPGSGVLVLFHELSRNERQAILRRLRWFSRRLTILDEASGRAARVHNLPELRRALLRRMPFIMLSPLCPTASHPDRRPLPRMRAATLARLAGRRLIALGGMDAKRFRRIERLGFQAWAGISAFRT